MDVFELQYNQYSKLYRLENLYDVKFVRFSPNAQLIAVGNLNNFIDLYFIKNGKHSNRLKGHSKDIHSVCFSPDGQRLITCSLDYTMKIWNTKTGKLLKTFCNLPENEWISYDSEHIYYESSTKGGQYAGIRFNNETNNWKPLLFEVILNQGILKIKTGNESNVGKRTTSDTIHEQYNELKLKGYMLNSNNRRKNTDDKNSHVISNSDVLGNETTDNIGTATKVNMPTGANLSEDILNQDIVKIKTGNEPNVGKRTKSNTKHEQYNKVKPKSYMLNSNNRRKNTDDKNSHVVSHSDVLENETTENIDTATNVNMATGVNNLKLKQGNIEPVKYLLNNNLGNNFNQSKYKPNKINDPPIVTIYSPKNNIKTSKQRFPVKVKINSKSEVEDISVYVNGLKIEKKVGIPKFFENITIQDYYVDLFEGENTVRIVATNIKQLTAFAVVKIYRVLSVKKGILYFLSVGVNKLDFIPNNDLDFAAKDARDMSNIMKKMESKLYSSVKVDVYSDSSHNKPWLNKIKNALKRNFKDANENDTVIIFLAGHGITKNNQYFLLTKDSKQKYNRIYDLNTVLKWSDIYESLSQLKCKKLIIFDTCYTGGIDISNFKDGFKDTIILTSTSKGQLASECKEQKNGCFTHAIKKGLEEGLSADLNGDNQVMITELKDYILKELEQLTNQKPDIFIPRGLGNFVIYSN